MIYFIVFGGVIILALASYAAYLMLKLSNQKQTAKARLSTRVDEFTKSIQTIALALSQQQCDVAEGCIRLAVLLDSIPLVNKPDYASRFPSIHALYDKVKHMATHEERKRQPLHITRADDALRAELEEQYGVEIIREAQQLRHFSAD